MAQQTNQISKYDLWFSSLERIPNGRRRLLHQQSGSAERIYGMSAKELEQSRCLTEKDLSYLQEQKKTVSPDLLWETFQKSPVEAVRYDETDYPQKILQIPDHPYLLFIRGNLPQQTEAVGIVGARMCSEYGRSIARKLGEMLGQKRIPVISGMALGIDSASQAGALSVGGYTCAVLGCGCDICYPNASRNIYHNILESGGCILSEYLPGTAALPYHFPARNRLISALSDLVIVVEARRRSGSLITADFALEQGKEVFAVPGRLGDALSEGCNHLIAQGAGVLYDLDEFFRNINLFHSFGKIAEKTDPDHDLLLEKEEFMVYSCLNLTPRSIHEIARESNLNLLSVFHSLGILKEKGLIQETFQNYYCKRM